MEKTLTNIPKVTVYIPSYNYEQYVENAIQSVLRQSMNDWELIVINDGSTDNTKQILGRYESHPKIIIIDQENKGLNVTNNIALRLSRGRYIMRLDADDYLDENALIVLSNILDTKFEVGLVYPDYYEVDQSGEVINLVRRKKLFEEVEFFDLPAHGACTMFRKECLLQIGGYAEEFSCQDGYDIWLRFIRQYQPYNVNVPLFYYRQHPTSLTNNKQTILNTRHKIKSNFVKSYINGQIPVVLGVIPTVTSSMPYRNPFQPLAGKLLIDYTLEEATRAKRLDRIAIASDDDQVLQYVENTHPQIIPIKRPQELSRSTVKMYQVINFVLDEMKRMCQYAPDAVCTLYVTTPLRRAHHIDNAIDTMIIFDADSVVSIQEELSPYYHHRRYGLEPLQATQDIRPEKEAIYKENGAVYLSKAHVFRGGKLIGKKVGHITMLSEESIKVSNPFDLWICEKIIGEWLPKEHKAYLSVSE